MSALTTHVLDTMRGCPARGMTIELWSIDQTISPITAIQMGTINTALHYPAKKPRRDCAALLG